MRQNCKFLILGSSGKPGLNGSEYCTKVWKKNAWHKCTKLIDFVTLHCDCNNYDIYESLSHWQFYLGLCSSWHTWHQCVEIQQKYQRTIDSADHCGQVFISLRIKLKTVNSISQHIHTVSKKCFENRTTNRTNSFGCSQAKEILFFFRFVRVSIKGN